MPANPSEVPHLVAPIPAKRPWARLYRIPAVKLSRAEWLAGKRGFVSHADVDPDRRTDPGRDFPWSRFLDLVRHQEDVMTPQQEAKLDDVLRRVKAVEEQLDDRKAVDDDLRRIRNETRATNDTVSVIAEHFGLKPVNPDVTDGGA